MNNYDEIIRCLLEDFSFEEILEFNDLTEEDVLEILIDRGLVTEPERYFP